MSRLNYKVFSDICTTNASRVRTLKFLDTSAGPNFIRKDALTIGYETYLKPGPLHNICGENGNRISMRGVVTLQVELCAYRLALDFIIFNRLATTCIFGTDFFDRFVEAIRTNMTLVELDNGTTIPIIRNPKTPAPMVSAAQYPDTSPMTTSSLLVRAADLREVHHTRSSG